MRLFFIIQLLLFFSVHAQIDSTTINNKKINENLCANVTVETDKYTNEISYTSPEIEDIIFIKIKSKGMLNQYVSISLSDSYFSGFNNYGLIILFKSGKKIDRPNEKIEANISNGGNWSYTAFFTPTSNEINLFKTDEIIGVKLYIFESNISEGEKLKEYSKCVLVSPKLPGKKR